ncbi:hypothetical protein GCM10009850_097240 [Nonomuraea monospora]|uniref:Uncharacterized protein n=1 Tax=Nonomuraea monospora TaxID=568818 RepID=A0ABN3CXQ9_9ACTN
MEIHAGDEAVGAHVGRAGLVCGGSVRVRRGVAAGLALASSGSRLLCLRGRFLGEDDGDPAVKAALSAAVEGDFRAGGQADQDGDLDAPVARTVPDIRRRRRA